MLKLKDQFFRFEDYFDNLNRKNIKFIILLIVLLTSSIVGFFLYRWYKNDLQIKAHKAFQESMEVYKQALAIVYNKDLKSEEDMWDEVEIAFKTGYLQNKNSTIAPFFLIYQSEALIQQGKKKEGFDILTDAINQFTKNSPFYYLYKIKQNLIGIDMEENEESHKPFLKSLELLSEDSNNPIRDMALFNLGKYYMSHKNFEKAKEKLKKIEELGIKNSPFYNLAKEQLEKNN